MCTGVAIRFAVFSVVICLAAAACRSGEVNGARPNVILLYVDDLGYADVGSYGAEGVETPNIDALARTGISFTDAHSTAATCSPSRYSLLTGEHGFRIGAGILGGDSGMIIRPEKPTLPGLFKRAGYRTSVIGKWHLGLGNGDVDWNGAIKPGPLEIGFDYSFLMPATGDRVPTVLVEQHHVVGANLDDPISISFDKIIGRRPTGVQEPDALRVNADKQHSGTIINGVSRIGFMAGGHGAEWVDEALPSIFTDKAIDFIESDPDTPFFLFYAFHDIHVPRMPAEQFVGRSSMGPRGDAIVQVDWVVGKIVETLRKLGIEERTIVIFTSDNGPVLNDGYDDRAVEKVGRHIPSGPFRGGKYSVFEAGTRVPMILNWRGTVGHASSDALMSQIDFYASFARLLDIELRPGEAPDSRDYLDALLGRSASGRETLILESSLALGLREKQWKYIAPVDADVTLPLQWLAGKSIESGLAHEPQLYDLSTDLGEQTNLANDQPNRVRELSRELQSVIEHSY